MGKSGRITFLIIISLLVFSCNQQKQTSREKISFGNGWRFKMLDTSDTSSTLVNIPHTTKIEPLLVNNQWQGKAAYQKNFRINSIAHTKYFFYFEGVMQEASVYINDTRVLTHEGGYLPFTVDATPYLRENAMNSIIVKLSNVDNVDIPPGKLLNGLDFNMYGGIYRDVYLVKTNEVYITNPVAADKVNGGGVFVKFDSITKKSASGFIQTHIKNEAAEDKNLIIEYRLKDKDETEVFQSFKDFKIKKGGEATLKENISVADPKLWSPDTPNLYDLEINVLDDGTIIDHQTVSTGIRNIKLTDTAFYLNGEKLFLNGTNRHQEYPFVGYALSDEAQYRDAYKIKMAGFNFVRLSHYPHSEAFMAACDELGLLVMDCIPGWQYFGGKEFVKNSLQDTKDLVRRDRNHPAVIFWENSLNESEMSSDYMKKVNEVVRAELPYKDTYTAGWINNENYDLFIPARQHAKPPFYWNKFDEEDRPILIAEYGDWEYYAQNAGFNQKAYSDLKESERSSRQLRSSGETGLLQQALNFQEAFNSNLQGKQVIGQANWLMFDYNRGYTTDLEASGISDIFRIPKFSYYFYKSQKDVGDDKFSKPMIFIANYWTPKSSTNIKVYSNTEEVALYLNDSLIERKKPTINSISNKLPHPPFEFELKNFKEGSLKAVGYINNREVATHTVRTPKAPSKIALSYDTEPKKIASNSPDMVFVYAKIVDENGTLVTDATNKITFSIVSELDSAKIIGENPVSAEAGIATVLIRTTVKDQPVEIEASGENLNASTLKL